jgi:hypothetical protein
MREKYGVVQFCCDTLSRRSVLHVTDFTEVCATYKPGSSEPKIGVSYAVRQTAPGRSVKVVVPEDVYGNGAVISSVLGNVERLGHVVTEVEVYHSGKNAFTNDLNFSDRISQVRTRFSYDEFSKRFSQNHKLPMKIHGSEGNSTVVFEKDSIRAFQDFTYRGETCVTDLDFPIFGAGACGLTWDRNMMSRPNYYGKNPAIFLAVGTPERTSQSNLLRHLEDDASRLGINLIGYGNETFETPLVGIGIPPFVSCDCYGNWCDTIGKESDKFFNMVKGFIDSLKEDFDVRPPTNEETPDVLELLPTVTDDMNYLLSIVRTKGTW